METIVAQSTKRIVDENMTDPEFARTTATYLKNLRERLYTYQGVICQQWARYDYDIYEAFAFSQVHYMMCCADIVMARVKIGVTPCKDREIGLMNDLLGKNLWEPFSAKFWGGTQDEDGVFKIEKPIEFDMAHWKTHEQVIKAVSGDFPLEVGYTSGMKTLHTLRTRGRLARWPYDDEMIYLLYTDKISYPDYGNETRPIKASVNLCPRQLSFYDTVS